MGFVWQNVGKCLHAPWNPMWHSNLPSRWLSLVMGRSPGCVDGGFLLLNLHDICIFYIYIHGFLLRLWAEHNIPWHNTHYTHYMNALFSEHAWTCMKQFSETSPLGPIPSFPSTECLLADAFIDLDVHCRLIVLVGGEDLWLLRGNHLGVAARARTRKVNGTDWLEVPIPYIRPIYSIYKAHVRGYP
jgi:hypothetical protein